MTAAARSVLMFGVYMLAQGAVLLVAPNVLLGLLGFEPAQDVWPRAAGIALMVLGLYYVAAARGGWTPFFRLTVVGRTLQFVAFAGLIAAGLGPTRLLATSGVELASGVWTFFLLRRERSSGG